MLPPFEFEESRYVVIDLLGKGAFGQVVKCYWEEEEVEVALKVVKNKESYYNLAMNHEIPHLSELNRAEDGKEERKIIKMLEHFEFQKHVFIVFELLDISLYDVLKETQFNGFTLEITRRICQQVLDAMSTLHKSGLIHSDIKPENILFNTEDDDLITLIDLGSSCRNGAHFFDYIQSRFYRAPEVILGQKYGMEIDMWSFGCLAAELYIGLPFFHGSNDYDQLHRIIGTCGMPSLNMIYNGKHHTRYFTFGKSGQVSLKPIEQFARESRSYVEPQRHFHPVRDFADFEGFYEASKLRESARPEDKLGIGMFVDFLQRILRMSPRERMTPEEALAHPFITNDLAAFERFKKLNKKEQNNNHITHALEQKRPKEEIVLAGLDSPFKKIERIPSRGNKSPTSITDFYSVPGDSRLSYLTTCSGSSICLYPTKGEARCHSSGGGKKRRTGHKLIQKKKRRVF